MSTQPNSQQTMDLLWTRIRRQGDLPGFSKVVESIMKAIRGEGDPEFNMATTVLADPALTQKVLRLANSAMYSVFGQGINTVSKAVLIIGTESIGHLALGSKLIDGLAEATAGSATTRNEMGNAVLAGHIARQVTRAASTRDAEEAVVCSMLHGLGRIMVTFYLPEQWAAVQSRGAEPDFDEAQATLDTLGLALEEVGRQIARKWGLSPALIDSMQHVLPHQVDEPLGHAAWLGAISTLSSQCARVMGEDENADLTELANGYAGMLGVDSADIVAAAQLAKEAVTQEAQMGTTLKPRRPEPSLPETKPDGKPADALRRLTRGATDMREVVNNASATQLMAMALETMYQGLGLSRAIIFLRNEKAGTYFARMGFGDGVQALSPQLVFGDAYQPDVFHAGLANDKVIVVRNAKDPAFVTRLPRWWRDAFPMAHSFAVLPLSANRRPFGFIYGDWDSPTGGGLEAAELLPLNELRALLVQAMGHRSQQLATSAD